MRLRLAFILGLIVLAAAVACSVRDTGSTLRAQHTTIDDVSSGL